MHLPSYSCPFTIYANISAPQKAAGHRTIFLPPSQKLKSPDDLNFVTWRVMLLEQAAIRRWVHCCHKLMYMVGNHTQVCCLNKAQLLLMGQNVLKKISSTALHKHHQQSELLIQGRIDQCFQATFVQSSIVQFY